MCANKPFFKIDFAQEEVPKLENCTCLKNSFYVIRKVQYYYYLPALPGSTSLILALSVRQTIPCYSAVTFEA